MKKIRIWKSPWHLAHDYDLMMALKDVADFDLLVNYTRRWDERIRPFPPNANWVIDFEKDKYDLAILNIDQQCSNFDLNKANLTVQMKKTIKEIDPKVPIIFINHGTPVYPELFADATPKTNYVSEQLKKEIMDIVGDDYMVVNSAQASKDWGKGFPIIHGMDIDEWKFSEEREPRVATFISIAGIGDKYYNRSYLAAVMELLNDKYAIKLQWINTPNSFTAKNIDDYKEFLSRTLVYFNPTYASPMPRSRTEAMLSGCCVVTTETHGAKEFIEEGFNGFFVPHNNPEYASKLIASLIKDNYELAKEIGLRGRETAKRLFSRERYSQDWQNLIDMVLKKNVR